MKKIVILGATGSIGTQALSVIEQSENLSLLGVSANSNITLLEEIIHKFNPKFVSVTSKEDAEKLAAFFPRTVFFSGMEGLIKLATLENADIILTSVVGSVGLIPTVEAIRAGKTIALANKETLVTGGEIVMNLAREHSVSILPVDSEHSAIYQCLVGENSKTLKKVYLTASGGAFRDFSKQEISRKKAVDALKHPNWSMGNKITIDSATLMNKGFEFIEAIHLFNLKPEQIEVLIHRESIIHSMVEFIDGSIMAQLGYPDMKMPISYALNKGRVSLPLGGFSAKSLTFDTPDLERFPCLDLAVRTVKDKGNRSIILNAANEVLVEAYLKDKIGFYDISDIILEFFEKERNFTPAAISEIVEYDLEIKKKTWEIINANNN